jgi:hypothetical protein
LRDSLFLQKGRNHFAVRLHTHGQHSLIRGALENASRMVWLLESDDRGVRVLRRLQMEYAEVRQQEKARQEMRQRVAKTMDTRFKDLSALAGRVGVEPGLIKKGPDYTAIVRAAGEHVASGGTVQVVIWKACSAMAHGEFRGALAYSAKETFGDVSPGVELIGLTADVSLLTTGTLAAIGTMEVALNLYGRRMAAPGS